MLGKHDHGWSWEHQPSWVHCIFQEIDSSSDLCHDIALLDALLIKTLIHDGTYQSLKLRALLSSAQFKYKSDLLPGVNSSVDAFFEMCSYFSEVVVTISKMLKVEVYIWKHLKLKSHLNFLAASPSSYRLRNDSRDKL